MTRTSAPSPRGYVRSQKSPVTRLSTPERDITLESTAMLTGPTGQPFSPTAHRNSKQAQMDELDGTPRSSRSRRARKAVITSSDSDEEMLTPARKQTTTTSVATSSVVKSMKRKGGKLPRSASVYEGNHSGKCGFVFCAFLPTIDHSPFPSENPSPSHHRRQRNSSDERGPSGSSSKRIQVRME